MSPIDVLAVAVIVLWPINLWVAWYLSRLSRRHPELPTLADRAFSARFWAIESTIAAFFSFARLFHLVLWPDVVTILLIAALVIPSIPNVRWGAKYLTDGLE